MSTLGAAEAKSNKLFTAIALCSAFFIFCQLPLFQSKNKKTNSDMNSILEYKENMIDNDMKCDNDDIKCSAKITAIVLSSTDDRFAGVRVDSKDIPSNVEIFYERLILSLKYWKHEKKRSAWLKLPIKLASHLQC